MATITDDDLKMFQKRAKTEFASRCDTGGIAWDSVIWDLCNEVRKLRSVSKEHGDCAKLREALDRLAIASESFLRTNSSQSYADTVEALYKARAALAAPPRNCDAMDWRTAWKIWREKFHPETPVGYSAVVKGTEAFMDWFTAPATEQEGENDGNE